MCIRDSREDARLTAITSSLRSKLGAFSHSHWGDTILNGGACASEAQLREDARLGRTLHEVQLRCSMLEDAHVRTVGTSFATLDLWSLAYAGVGAVPRGLSSFHRAPHPGEARVAIQLDGFLQTYYLPSAAFHDASSGRFDDFAFREAARRSASAVCCSFFQPPLGDPRFDCGAKMRCLLYTSPSPRD